MLPGVQVTDPAKCELIKHTVLRLWDDVRSSGDVALTPPAPLPVSLTMDALHTVASEEYLVTAKLDGTRCLLLLMTFPPALGGHPAAVLVNRSWQAYQVPVDAPASHFSQGSLFDGELVRVPVPGAVGEAARDILYIFDVVALRGACVTQRRYTPHPTPQAGAPETRWEILKRLFFDTGEDDAQLRNPAEWQACRARELASKGRVVCRGGPTHLSFHTKQWFSVRELARVLRCGPQDGAPWDGLVFMPAGAPMGSRRTPWLYKWKDKHTIDVVVPPGGGAPLYWDGTNMSCAPLELRNGQHVTLPVVQSKPNACGLTPLLLECAIVPDVSVAGGIVLQTVRARTDKAHPNDGRTIAATIMDCLEPVTLEHMLNAVGYTWVQ